MTLTSGTARHVEHRRPRILLVDDEAAVLDGMRRLLRRDYDVFTAESAERALALMAAAEPFAVVVSDLQMPGMGGARFLAIVRDNYPDTVRLLLTGKADLNSTIAAINEGQINRFLLKPSPGWTVEAVLKEAVETHRRLCAERDLVRAARVVVQSLDGRQGTQDLRSQQLGPVPGEGLAEPAAASRPSTLGERLAAVRSARLAQGLAVD